ncbi:MAG: cytochrome c biogenesis protein CcsA [Neomegalonema sp.]|nr:cytochrome c biogenesis protein CcsA [Neomegalonema sp.]
MMVVELGHFALALALLVALLQGVAPAIGATRGRLDLMRIGDNAAIAQFTLVAASFAALIYAFVNTDLSVSLVYQHSSIDKPLGYKIAGVWANHEGSMLLWALMLALFGALVALFGRRLPQSLRARTLSVQGVVSAAFLAFILFSSSPFARWPEGMDDAYLRQLLAANATLPGLEALLPKLDKMSTSALLELAARYGDALRLPVDGRDLNPVLQDPGLALHPPILYAGYVGLSIAYSFAVAALWEGKVDAAWARWVRPWTLFAWIALTLGIALGSYWAYYELGWGGWWFWDPVENASFMPWLAATALLHSAIVVEKRGELKSWTVLLAIVAFSFSLFGAFLVRSGVLASVHAFASDPSRGLFILAILVLFVGGALTLYAWRAPGLASGGMFALVSREAGLLLNNVLLASSLAAVFVGTVAPIVFQAFSVRVTIGPPFFNIMMALFFTPLIALAPLGAATPWKRAVANAVLWRAAPAMAAAFVGMIGAAWAQATAASDGAVTTLDFIITCLGALLGFWAIFGAIYELLERARLPEAVRGEASLAEVGRRLLNTPLATVGKAAAHAGLGVFVLGAILSHGLSSSDIRTVKIGDQVAHGDIVFRVLSIQPAKGSNYTGLQATVAVYNNGARIATVTPERRRYTTRAEITSEVGLSTGLLRDLYVVLGERRADGGWVLRTEVKPLVSWVWLGCIMMSLGGLFSLLDRRLRIGAPALRKGAAAATTAMIALAAALTLAPTPTYAIEPEEQFTDKAMESRARRLFRELRCMTCDNQSVDDSNAPIATDIRAFARKHMAAGETDAEIKARLVAAYGEEVLLAPPFFGRTFIVWLLPLLALGMALALGLARLKKRAAPAPSAPEAPPLSAEEQAQLDAIMAGKDRD